MTDLLVTLRMSSQHIDGVEGKVVELPMGIAI